MNERMADRQTDHIQRRRRRRRMNGPLADLPPLLLLGGRDLAYSVVLCSRSFIQVNLRQQQQQSRAWSCPAAAAEATTTTPFFFFF